MSGSTIVLITVPFFLWNPAAFWRAVVEFQFIQPFRIDALSHLVWMHNGLPLWSLVRWTPFALAVPATAFAGVLQLLLLRRGDGVVGGGGGGLTNSAGRRAGTT